MNDAYRVVVRYLTFVSGLFNLLQLAQENFSSVSTLLIPLLAPRILSPAHKQTFALTAALGAGWTVVLPCITQTRRASTAPGWKHTSESCTHCSCQIRVPQDDDNSCPPNIAKQIALPIPTLHRCTASTARPLSPLIDEGEDRYRVGNLRDEGFEGY